MMIYSFDTVIKMKAELSLLNSQITLLTKSKEEIELYYQEELKKLIASVEEKNETIDELDQSLNIVVLII
jgi:predicted DNA-binding ArsR family transcriptional regulator